MPGLPTGTITLLFTDIEGSTHLLQQLGERYADMLTECRQLLRTVFQQWNGHEVDTQGDAFFVAFARATDAVSAAVAAQLGLACHSFPEGVEVRIRMGLHTGEPQPSYEGYVGLDVHHAARIVSIGYGGQVLLSQTTRDLVQYDLPEGVGLRDMGEHRLKDLQRPSHLFQLVIGDLPADFPPLKTLDSRPNNLPVQLTQFIGREKEVAAVQHLLQREDVRLVTLTGPGGTGKTRLGLQVASQLSDAFTNGVYFVNLAPINDPEFVVLTIARTLDIKEIAEQALLDLLKASLREKQLLLLLDNFEQVVGAAVYVSDLLATCPKLKVVVTSRAVLHVQGEQEFAVPPLQLPDPRRLPGLEALSQYEAVALFIQRVRAAKPDFQVTNTNAPAVAEICARLDGLPLAIELAAARIKVLSPQALLARLGQRLHMLTSGARDVPARQQTLRNAIEWSYQLLDAAEQWLFRHLSVFVGGCTLEAAEAVCHTLGDVTVSVLDGVASLIDKSLLQQREQEGEEPRLQMLETIREYGLECLSARGETEVTQQAHSAYYLALVEEAEPKLRSAEQETWWKRLDQEQENVRAALSWLVEQGEGGHSIEPALRMSSAMWWYWMVRGHLSEGRKWLERALARSAGVTAAVRVKALNATQLLAFSQDDLKRVEVLCRESLKLCQEIGDKAGLAHTLQMQGLVATVRGDYIDARSLLEKSLAISRELGDVWSIAYALADLVNPVLIQGDYERARSLAEEALRLFRTLGDKWGIAYGLRRLADVYFAEGKYAQVQLLIEEGLTLFREVGDKEDMALSLVMLGRVILEQGDIERANSLAEESLMLFKEIDSAWGTVHLYRPLTPPPGEHGGLPG